MERNQRIIVIHQDTLRRAFQIIELAAFDRPQDADRGNADKQQRQAEQEQQDRRHYFFSQIFRIYFITELQMINLIIAPTGDSRPHPEWTRLMRGALLV